MAPIDAGTAVWNENSRGRTSHLCGNKRETRARPTAQSGHIWRSPSTVTPHERPATGDLDILELAATLLGYSHSKRQFLDLAVIAKPLILFTLSFSLQRTTRQAAVVCLPNTWGHVVQITSVNGVDRRLSEISRELDELSPQDKRYLYPPAGACVRRPVADTDQPSMHAWGAAIDINPAFSDYWLWHRAVGDGPADVNRIPLEIVAIFERHGFIWGGRWAHFDTMHFEYRPELLRYDAARE